MLTLLLSLFVLVRSAGELVENATYIVGAQAQAPVGYDARPFYLLTPTLGAKSTEFMTAPAQLQEDCEAALWHIVREGGDIVLEMNGQFLQQKKPNETPLALSATQHTRWTVTEVPNREVPSFELSHAGRYLRISSLTTSAKFGCYTRSQYENTLCLYRCVETPEAMSEYARFWEQTGWETVYLPFSTALPTGFEAYTLKAVQGDVPQYEPATSLEAYTPYVVRGLAGHLFRVKRQGYAAPASVQTLRASHRTPQRPALGRVRRPTGSESILLTGTLVPLVDPSGLVLDGSDFVEPEPGCVLPAFRAYLR